MAIFRLNISSIQRSLGRRATASAAYRAGERICDERSGELHDHRARRDVAHTQIFLPAQFAGTPIAWAQNRERLWNIAEHTEKRRNSHVAREFEVSLPHELNDTQRLVLAQAFARDICERYKVAVDLTVHDPPRDGDPRHFHAHLLATTREVTAEGLGAKTGLDMQGRERARRGLPDHRQEFVNVRERWAILANAALRAANVAARIDHRSLAAQGIDREPLPHIPLSQWRLERRGERSPIAERLRAAYRERVQRRQERSAGRDAQQSRAGRQATNESEAGAVPRGGDVEEIRRQAREAWVRLRSKQVDKAGGQSSDREQDSLPSQPQPKGDFSL